MANLDLDFKALPKIELHAHLSGSISRQCLHDIWLAKSEKGEVGELRDPLIEMPADKFDYDLETFFPLFSSYIYTLLTDGPSITTSTLSVLESFANDGIIYLELRTTPRAIPSASITKEDYTRLVLDAIATFSASAANRTPSGAQMTTSLLLSVDRRNSPAEAMAVIELAAKLQCEGAAIAGVDLCGDPARGDVSSFRDAFAAAREYGLKITIHFAEAPPSSSAAELEEILSWYPDRLGHVIHVPAEARKVIEERRLGLELCLSCNVHARMITGSYGDHHFGYWRETKCPVVLCTDDVGVFGSEGSNEYRLVAEHFGLDKTEILDLARRGVECIFASEEEKERIKELMW